MPDIQTREQLKQQINSWQKEGLKVGLTSGVFDLLHVGHLDYLIKSKEVCDKLVVAVNSNNSVKQYKGPARPILDQIQRARLVAGLKPIDAVFIFDERNNNINIQELRPDVYIKAGDYDKSKLSSAPIIEAYGGKVELIPLVEDTSSSNIIDTVLSKSLACFDQIKSNKARKAIFLDRDGVINVDIEYLHEPDKFELAPKVREACELLAKQDYAIIIVTNQAGIGLGYFQHEDFYRINRKMFKELSGTGLAIERIYYCPHSFNEPCKCRKPKTGMIERGFQELNLIREGSWMVGDRATDIEAGKAAQLNTALIGDAEGVKTDPDFKAENLLEAVQHIIEQES
jgi:rfaE bifunctional protein nucleotidyltransferase chain/domain